MKRATTALLLFTLVGIAYAKDTNAIKDDDAAAVRAAAITSHYELTTLSTECLYFDTKDEGTDFLVRVREKHDKACGDDPDTSPTVFFLKLRKSDGHAKTTAYHPGGDKFENLRAKSH